MAVDYFPEPSCGSAHQVYRDSPEHKSREEVNKVVLNNGWNAAGIRCTLTLHYGNWVVRYIANHISCILEVC